LVTIYYIKKLELDLPMQEKLKELLDNQIAGLLTRIDEEMMS